MNSQKNTNEMTVSTENKEIVMNPYSGKLSDFENGQQFIKLSLTEAQKAKLSALIRQIPTAAGAGMLSQAYAVKFPEGLPHVLTEMKQGGYGSIIRENGKIVGHASFYKISSQAALLGAFSVMSAATGQYFLAQINRRLENVSQQIIEVMRFLQNDKVARLKAEICFIQDACRYYDSVIRHEAQRIATIGNIQRSRITAVQNVDFYLNELKDAVHSPIKSDSDYETLFDHVYHILILLDQSQKLYIESYLLEIFYSMNQDISFLSRLGQQISEVNHNYNQSVLSCLGVLETYCLAYRPKAGLLQSSSQYAIKLLRKFGNEKWLRETRKCFNETGEACTEKILASAFSCIQQDGPYYLTPDGTVYIKRLNQ